MSEVGAGGVTVAFRTLGCKVNRAESEAIAANLLGRGVRLCDPEDAAVIVVNTCTVTGEADAKARKVIRQALSARRGPIVVVTGCLAALEPTSLEAMGEKVIVEAHKDRIAGRVAKLLRLEQQAAHPTVRSGAGFRTRAMLKIEDGCDNCCTYCIVPYARGIPRSTPLAEVVAAAERLLAAGVGEIVLTGVNIGRYRDAETGVGLGTLIEALAAAGVGRLRLSSIEPLDLSLELRETLAATPAVVPHLHVPLQSGSDAVLRAMGRHYTAEEYEQIVTRARAALPGLTLTTDVIVGFPGESDEDADATVDLCNRVGFAKLHVFRFSARRGTPAADMPTQVHPTDRAQRARALSAVGESLHDRFSDERIGSVTDVLVERTDTTQEGRFVQGTSSEYLKVRFRADSVEIGRIVPVRLVGRDGTGMLGEQVAGLPS